MSAPVRVSVLRGAVAVLAAVVSLATAAAAPASPEAMALLLREAIAARDYERIADVINWDGAGTIKRRIVAFQVRRGLGRAVKSIDVEPADDGAIRAGAAELGQHPNMAVSHKIRIVYDESPSDGAAGPPTAVYLVGQAADGWHIALVVRDPRARDND